MTGKMWCVGQLTPEYVERMEYVLDLYERPLDKKEPAVIHSKTTPGDQPFGNEPPK